MALGQVTNSPKGLGMAGQSVRCHDCRADHNSCNVGECQGVVCVKMETSNMDNGKHLSSSVILTMQVVIVVETILGKYIL